MQQSSCFVKAWLKKLASISDIQLIENNMQAMYLQSNQLYLIIKNPMWNMCYIIVLQVAKRKKKQVPN